MKAVIVGHGPSLLQEKMGHLIDEFDYVVRLKRCQQTLEMPEYYGTKTTHVGGSLTIAGQIRDIPATEYWVFLDSRHEKVPDEHLEMTLPRLFGTRRVAWDRELCDEWDRVYRARRDYLGPIEMHPQMKFKDSSSPEGENHTSQGFKALLYAVTMLPVEEVILIGFDNLLTGDFTWSVTRGPEWRHYPPHRWDVERDLLTAVRDRYGVSVGFLLPETEEDDGQINSAGH